MTQASLRQAGPALEAARFEIIPTGSIEERVLEHIPAGATITVTASPTKGLEATLGLAERLSVHGYTAVPHVSARLVRDEAHLRDIVARLREHGIDDVFVPAGDADPPAGDFDSALSLLLALESLGRPFGRVGITGYPQTHPIIHDDITIQAMWDKRRYATYIVSNLCFDAATLKRWIGRVRARGVALPLRLGLAGPVDRTKLLTMASKIGVADSSRYLRNHSSWMLRLGAPGGYSPTKLLERLGPTLAAESSAVEGLHVFTFNQVQESEQWRRHLLAQISGSSKSRRSMKTRAGGTPAARRDQDTPAARGGQDTPAARRDQDTPAARGGPPAPPAKSGSAAPSRASALNGDQAAAGAAPASARGTPADPDLGSA